MQNELTELDLELRRLLIAAIDKYPIKKLDPTRPKSMEEIDYDKCVGDSACIGDVSMDVVLDEVLFAFIGDQSDEQEIFPVVSLL